MKIPGQISTEIYTQGVNYTLDTQIQVGRGGSASLLGTVRWVIVLDHAALGESLTDAASLTQSALAP